MTVLGPGIVLAYLATILVVVLTALAISTAVVVRCKSRTIGSFAADLTDVFLGIASDYRRRERDNATSRELRRAHRDLRRTRNLRPPQTPARRSQ